MKWKWISLLFIIVFIVSIKLNSAEVIIISHNHTTITGGGYSAGAKAGVIVNFTTDVVTFIKEFDMLTNTFEGTSCYIIETGNTPTCNETILATGTISGQKCSLQQDINLQKGRMYILAVDDRQQAHNYYSSVPLPIGSGILVWKYGWNTAVGGTCNSSTNIYALSNVTVQTLQVGEKNHTYWFQNSQNYTFVDYETSYNSFILNATSYINYASISATLVYDGTNHTSVATTSGTNILFNSSFYLPLNSVWINQYKDFYWVVSATNISGTFSNSSFVNTQKVNLINLTYCGFKTNSYFNFSFKNEKNSSSMSALIDLVNFKYRLGSGTEYRTLDYSATNSNISFGFCFPPNRTLSSSFDIRYSASGYPQRIGSYLGIYTNITTQYILYLLSSSDGIYSSIIVQDGFSRPITNVSVKAEREISGEWVTIGQYYSDSAGSVTFWVNPDYSHKITASKTGYETLIETIRPTASSYTMTMQQEAVSQNYSYKGINWNVGPRTGVIYSPSTDYLFYFNASSSEGNLANCKMELRNNTRDILGYNTSAGNLDECYVSITFNSGSNPVLYGYLYLDLGSGYELLKANDPWIFENVTRTTTYRLWDALKSFNELEEWGDTHNRREFSKIVAFFFIITLIISVFTFTTGYDFAQPGGALLLLWGLIFAGSITGIFEIRGISSVQFFDKYLIFFTCSFITWGYFLGQWRKTA